MPQLNNKERDAVQAEFNANSETAEAAKGLVIYNTDTDCMEFWNGKEWIGLCSDALSPPPTVEPETNPTPTINNYIRITAYINAMYDFQRQTLTAYLTSGDATAYQWQISKDGATWYDIVGAKSANYIIPADFMYKLGDLGLDKDNTATGASNSSIEIQFRCQITSGGATDNIDPTKILNMLFIRTNTPGYGIDPATGVRYLTIQTGNKNFPSGRMKIALLNLGQSGTGAWLNGVHQPDNGELNDAGDLSDFYQWGRVADGHEHTVWSKNSSYANQISPNAAIAGDLSATSMSTTPMASVPAGELDDNGQILPASSSYGKFVASPNINTWWGKGNSNASNLWGKSGDNPPTRNDGSDIPFSSWAASAKDNNPCPSGWYVPSIWNLWDIYLGDGANTIDLSGVSPFAWSSRSSSNNAYGVLIIPNNLGELVFLPEDGMRGNDGSFAYTGGYGSIWSSTMVTDACFLFFTDGYLRYSSPSTTSGGYGVRCVAE